MCLGYEHAQWCYNKIYQLSLCVCWSNYATVYTASCKHRNQAQIIQNKSIVQKKLIPKPDDNVIPGNVVTFGSMAGVKCFVTVDSVTEVKGIDAEAECIGNVVDCPVATDNTGVATDNAGVASDISTAELTGSDMPLTDTVIDSILSIGIAVDASTLGMLLSGTAVDDSMLLAGVTTDASDTVTDDTGDTTVCDITTDMLCQTVAVGDIEAVRLCRVVTMPTRDRPEGVQVSSEVPTTRVSTAALPVTPVVEGNREGWGNSEAEPVVVTVAVVMVAVSMDAVAMDAVAMDVVAMVAVVVVAVAMVAVVMVGVVMVAVAMGAVVMVAN